VVGDLSDLAPVSVPGVDPGTVPVDDRLRAEVEDLREIVLRGRRTQPTTTSETR
jgi:hypothetical protein